MSDCTPVPFTSPNGLPFRVKCETNSHRMDILTVGSSSIEDCMIKCSELDANGTCYGVTFNFEQSLCFLKNESIYDETIAFSDPKVISGFADFSLLRALEDTTTECPFEDSSTQTMENGMTFRVTCNMENAGQNLVFTNQDAGRLHTDTMEECMELCSKSQPGCFGVSWIPNISRGYSNCYPKATRDSAGLQQAKYPVHAAVAITETDNTCIPESEQVIGDKTFSISCASTSDSPDLAVVHAGTLSACIAECAKYAGSDGAACAAVAYDGALLGGYENCYLKAAEGSVKRSDQFAFARDTAFAETAAAATLSNSGDRGIGAPGVAGIVVGVVVTIAIAVLLALLVRRKKRKQQQAAAKLDVKAAAFVEMYAPNEKDLAQLPEPPKEAFVSVEMEHRTMERKSMYELEQASYTHELDSAEVKFREL